MDLIFTSKRFHDWKNILRPLEGCNRCVDSWKVSLPNPLPDSPNSC